MSARDGTPEERPDEPAVHVFDQTNGVLGADEDDAETGQRRDGTTTSPSSFGIPPIVSL
jgi:hypothetical protein